MKPIARRTLFTLVATASMLCAPALASAASIYLQTDTNTVSTGDTVIVRAYLDTDTAPINALDGTLHIAPDSSNIKIDDINLAGSVFTFWPRTPSLSQDGTNITFTGGVPGGISGTHKLLFSMVVTAEGAGDTTFTPTNLTLYLNDGKGTPTPLMSRAFTFTAQPAAPGTTPRNEWQSVVSEDTVPPQPFTILAGQDPSVFNGQKYIFFQALDADSGIDHYEVQENDAPPVRSGSTYVLQHQTGPVHIIVYAYDKAGNVRTATYSTSASNPVDLRVLALVVIALLLTAFYLYRQRNKMYRI